MDLLLLSIYWPKSSNSRNFDDWHHFLTRESIIFHAYTIESKIEA